MQTFLPLTLLIASLPLIHAAPKGFKTRSFTDTHGSGLEIYPGRKRAVIPAQATTLPDAPPLAFAPIPTHIPAGSKREASADADPGIPSFNIPIPALAIHSSPQPTAAAAAAAVKREASANANAEPDTIHPLFFNPMPDFKAESSDSGSDSSSGNDENKRDAEADAEAQVIPALNFPPMPAHKLDDGSSSGVVKREAEGEAVSEPEPEQVFTAHVPIPTFALGN